MAEYIKDIIAYILAPIGLIAAIIGARLKESQLKESKLKISELEKKIAERENRIYKPTPEEVDRYSQNNVNYNLISRLKDSPVSLYIVAFFLFIAIPLHQFSQTNKMDSMSSEIESLKKDISDQRIIIDHVEIQLDKIGRYRENINNLHGEITNGDDLKKEIKQFFNELDSINEEIDKLKYGIETKKPNKANSADTKSRAAD